MSKPRMTRTERYNFYLIWYLIKDGVATDEQKSAWLNLRMTKRL